MDVQAVSGFRWVLNCGKKEITTAVRSVQWKSRKKRTSCLQETEAGKLR
jgi:hypothetical protein